MTGLAVVKVELDVEGLPAPPLPGVAPERAGVLPEVDAELVKAEQQLLLRRNFQNQAQVKVEIKSTAVKSEVKPPGEWLVKRPLVPPRFHQLRIDLRGGSRPGGCQAAPGRWGGGAIEMWRLLPAQPTRRGPAAPAGGGRGGRRPAACGGGW
jgi:hypothetical protein